MEPSNGLVISYNYLWAREYDRREESGRKARPACVQADVIALGLHPLDDTGVKTKRPLAFANPKAVFENRPACRLRFFHLN